MRNYHALNAIQRRSSKFKHRCAPRGGSSSWLEYLDQEDEHDDDLRDSSDHPDAPHDRPQEAGGSTEEVVS